MLKNGLILTLSAVNLLEKRMSSYVPHWKKDGYKKKKKSALPDRWEAYIPYGKPVPNSRFIGKKTVEALVSSREFVNFPLISDFSSRHPTALVHLSAQNSSALLNNSSMKLSNSVQSSAATANRRSRGRRNSTHSRQHVERLRERRH